MPDADGFFDAAAELGRIIAATRAAERQEKKDARKARRRAHYAVTKHLPKPARVEPVLPGDEYGDPDEWLAACTCYRSAPCDFCETRTDLD